MLIAKRIFLFAAGIFLTFVLLRFLVWNLPGSLADVLSDSETNAKDLELLKLQFETQGTFWKSFFDFIFLKWGESQLYLESSFPLILRHFRLTFFLSSLSLFCTFVFSLMFFLIRRKIAYQLSNVLLAIPAIAFYPLLVFVSCRYTQFCPAASLQQTKAILLAASAQALLSAPRFYRELEWELDNLRSQRFVLVLRAKGVAPIKIWTWHLFMNALAPFLSLLILTLLSFLSGAILLESLFDLPGIGVLLLESIRARDLNLIFSLVMFISLLHLFLLQGGKFLKFRKEVYG